MGKNNRCVYSLCQSSADKCGDKVFFLTFPRPKKDPNKCQRWIDACSRYDLDLLSSLQKRTVHICSLHFVGGNGPTSEYPDPIPFSENHDTLNLMGARNVANTTSCDDSNVSSSKVDVELMTVKMENHENEVAIKVENEDTNELSTKNLVYIQYMTHGEINEGDNVNYRQNEICSSTDNFTQTSPEERFLETDILDFRKLITVFKSSQIVLPNQWSYVTLNNYFSIFKSNIETSSLSISLTVSIESLTPVVKVYGKPLQSTHLIFKELREFTSVYSVLSAIKVINGWSFCLGMKEDKLKNQFETHEFNKKKGFLSFFTNHVHSVDCYSLLKKNKRTKYLCFECAKLKKKIHEQLVFRKGKTKELERRHSYMSREALQMKIKTLIRSNENLRKKVKRA